MIDEFVRMYRVFASLGAHFDIGKSVRVQKNAKLFFLTYGSGLQFGRGLGFYAHGNEAL